MELIFTNGNSIRRVFIKGRKVVFITPEYSFQPITFDLDQLDKHNLKKVKDSSKLIREVKNLRTEAEIAKDTIKDFQRSGWRLIKRK